MRKTFIIIFISLAYALNVQAVPKIAVFPFEPLMDSTYNWWGDQVMVLNYQKALHGFLVADLRQDVRFEVVALAGASGVLSSSLAEAKAAGADFAVIGTYAELPSSIRADAQLIDVGLGDVPRGYQASATAGRWEDLSEVSRSLADQLLLMAAGSATPRRESVSRLVLEGERDALGFAASSNARLVVEVNSPSPKVRISSGAAFKRCSVLDRSLADGSAASQICFVADVPPGEQSVSIAQRGFYGHEESLSLSPGKVYRLVVELQPMSFQTVPGRR